MDQKRKLNTSSVDIVVINKTGQPYVFYNDKRPDRLHVPHIIIWDEVR